MWLDALGADVAGYARRLEECGLLTMSNDNVFE